MIKKAEVSEEHVEQLNTLNGYVFYILIKEALFVIKNKLLLVNFTGYSPESKVGSTYRKR